MTNRPVWAVRGALALLFTIAIVTSMRGASAPEQRVPEGQKWVASWAASPHGPYPSGNASAQPVLDQVFPSPARGAEDQTFRLIVKPSLWSSRVRLHFTNVFGAQPLTLDDVFVGLQNSGATVVAGTSRAVRFGGQPRLTLEPGKSGFSDPIDLPFVTAGARSLLSGRRLAVSFHVPGTSGPMTWHAKALTTSYVTKPKAGAHGAEESDDAFPFSTTSWYFLDAVDVLAPDDTVVVACFGDSITDGTASTLNGDDRWPDFLAQRLAAQKRDGYAVVNAGIGGNQVIGPAEYSTAKPTGGGPSALSRLDRDVLGLSGVTTVIWLEGINDVSAGASADAIVAGLKEGVARLRAKGIRVIGATITSSLGSTNASGTPEADERRRAVNEFIRSAGAFDGVADFDAATRDESSGALRPEFVPNSTTGGAGDRLHPNRAGYQAMAHALDLALLSPSRRPR